MSDSYKPPGTYIEEIRDFPPFINTVETAIPIFIGVTEKATEVISDDLLLLSKKINSLADYELYFGQADTARASVNIQLNAPSSASLSSEYVNNMYYSVKHFFDNNGGPCYIHSIGGYSRDQVDANTYKNEIQKLNLNDEVTLIVMPDLAGLNSKTQLFDVYNDALQKAASLRNKFVILDVSIETTNDKTDIRKSGSAFRNGIANNQDANKYGAAFFPHLETSYNFDLNTAKISMNFASDVQSLESEVIINDVFTKVKPYSLLHNLDYNTSKSVFDINSLVQLLNDGYFNYDKVDV